MASEDTKRQIHTLKVDTNNTLVFETGGSGKALVFLHGWSCRRTDWKPIISSLEQEFFTVAIDLPGHGDAIATRAWSIKEFGGLVADVVRRLNLDEVVVIGHSMGGAVGLEASLILGETCRSVIAVDSLTYMGIYPSQKDETFMGGVRALEEDFSGTMMGLVSSLGAPNSTEELNKVIATEMAQADPQYAVSLMIDLYRWDMTSVLPKVPCPITAIAASVHLAPEAKLQLSSQIKIEEVDFGGHFFLRENPSETTKVLREALKI